VGLSTEVHMLHPLSLSGQQQCHCVTRDVIQALRQSCSNADGKLDLKSPERGRRMQVEADHQTGPNGEAVLAISTEKRTTGMGLRLLKHAMMVAFHLGMQSACSS